jgi:hypothetical protein
VNLVLNFDQSQSSLPSGFVSDVDYVDSYFDSLFIANITVTIDVGYGEIDGQSLGSNDLGESEQIDVTSVSYSAVRNALIAQGAPGSSTLPSSAPTGNPGTLYMASAEQKALGLLANNSSLDGYVGFDGAANVFSYAINSAPPSNEYYFVGVLEHEITEVMGRTSYLDYSHAYSAMDLFRYSAANTRQFSTGAPSYFSVNGGATDLNNWNNFQTGNSGDLGDWAPSAGNDAFDDNSNSGVINSLSSADFTLMNAIGWTTSSNTPTPTPTPTIGNPILVFATDDGTVPVWQVSGYQITAAAYTTFGGATVGVPGPGWGIVDATGDFTGDGESDILWQTTGGQVAIWEMKGTQITDAGYTTLGGAVVGVPAPGWTILGAANFTGDGESDILWQTANGSPAIWEMNGTQVTAASYTMIGSTVIGAPGADWHIIGAGDFTGNGDDDLLWRTNGGALAIWEMNGFQITDAAYITEGSQQVGAPGPDWHLITTADFYGNGIDDLLWETNAGQVAIWQMNGTQIVSAGYVSSGSTIDNAPAGWKLDGAQDVNGDGKADLLWQTPSGQVAVWEMNGTQVVGAGYLAVGNVQGTTPADWTIAQHNYNFI